MRKSRVAALFLVAACFAGHAYAGLIGAGVTSQYYAYGGVYNGFGSPTSFVANGTVQDSFCTSSCPEGFNLTVSNTQIDYSLVGTGPWSASTTSLSSGGLFIANGNLLTFTGVTITGVTLDAASTVPGLTQSNITFNAGNIAIDWAGLSTGGQQVILDVTTTSTTSTPEPAVWITTLAGCAMIAARRLKRS